MLDSELGNARPTYGPASVWAQFVGLDAWIWNPRPLVYDGDLARVNTLVARGFERVDTERHEWRLTALYGQLADVVTLAWPGAGKRRDRWAHRQDIERIDRVPVALAFTIPDDAPIPEPSAKDYRGLPMATAVPPPQLGERAFVLSGERWHTYALSRLGDDGLALWRQLGLALKELNAPAEWWMHSDELERCHDPRQYQAMREDLRSRLLATRGAEREVIRGALADLERLRKNAEKLRKAKERVARDPDAWLAQWQGVQQMAQDLAALYWRAHETAASIPATLEELEAAELTETAAADPLEEREETAPAELAELEATPEPVAALEVSEDARILAQIVEHTAASMDTPNYAEDRAVREASLAPKGAWQAEADIPRFKASNSLAVYFYNREHPLSIEDAQAQLQRIRPSTIITIRIAQGLWNLRRHDAKLAANGAAAIAFNDILQWRGVAKHSRPAAPGSERRITDGWRTEDREAVRQDFELASRYYLRGQHTVMYRGKAQTVNVDGPYMQVSFISVPTLWGEEPAGVWFNPGSWINSYESVGNYFLAEIDRRVFELNPQNEQHELKLALYLTELWRWQATNQPYDTPITMAELLQKSVIDVDRNMLTTRFAPRIEHALAKLRERGIIGAYECLNPPDRSKGKWGQDWLASRWRILPPDALRQSYVDKGLTPPVKRLGPGRNGSRK